MINKSKYYKCKKCGDGLSFSVDTGKDLKVEGESRIPLLYVLGCPECQFMITSRLMIVNPTDDKSD